MNKNSLYIEMYKKIENYSSKKIEIICFIIFCLATIFLSFFHEPWYDEFQAWGISKDNLYNILFVIPHFEGHPPLWHLILKCFSFFDVHPELCIKIPNLIFMAASVWLILFKSPFPRIIRVLLPFTYYIFYQYSIINRPYSMLLFALFLTAILHKTKNTNPYRFILALAFLSLTSLYGMAFAVGLTLVWVFEIWNKQRISAFIKSFIKDKRFYAMLGLFFVCCFISAIIFPDKNVTAFMSFERSPIFIKVLYCFLGSISDAFVTNLFNYSTLELCILPTFYTLVICAVGAFILFQLILHFKKYNALKYLYILFFCQFFFLRYIYPHHLGLIFVYMIFLFWLLIDNSKEKIKISKPLFMIIVLTIITNLIWSMFSSVYELKYNYAPSRSISDYIKKYSLTDYDIASNWLLGVYYIDEKGKKYYYQDELEKDKVYKKMVSENTMHQLYPILINPYFNRNLFINFKTGFKEKMYLQHYRLSEQENTRIKKEWKSKGKPEIIIGDAAKPGSLYLKNLQGYYVLKPFDGNMVWKDSLYSYNSIIYVQKGMYQELLNRVCKKSK